MLQIVKVFLVFVCFGSHGQLKDNLFAPLSIGDRMPDYNFVNGLNFSATAPSFADFKGKLVLFDFWSTRCASCIESWPKLLALQNQFQDKIQIILVNTSQNVSVVKDLFDRKKRITGLNMTLPSICGDTVLGKYFKHRSEPHVAWIDENGIVRYITGGSEVNSYNIGALLEGKVLNLKRKTDETTRIDFNKPLFVDGNGGNGEHILWQSVISRYFDGLYGTTKVSSNDKEGYSIVASNTSIIGMMRFAYGSGMDEYGFMNWLPPSRVILHVSDTNRYAEKIAGNIQYQNYYTYQLTAAKPTSEQKLRDMMKVDICRYFGLDARWEKRRLKCLVLTAEDTSLISYKGNGGQSFISDERIDLQNVTFSYFVKFLVNATNYHNSPYPIIDETRFNGKLGGVSFEANVMDYRALDDAFKRYKVRFRLLERDVEVLVISEMYN